MGMGGLFKGGDSIRNFHSHVLMEVKVSHQLPLY